MLVGAADARENSEVLLRYTSMAMTAMSEKMATNAENVNRLFFMEFLVLGSWFLVLGSWFLVLGSGLWALGSGLWALGSGLWAWTYGLVRMAAKAPSVW